MGLRGGPQPWPRGAGAEQRGGLTHRLLMVENVRTQRSQHPKGTRTAFLKEVVPSPLHGSPGVNIQDTLLTWQRVQTGDITGSVEDPK